MLDKKASPGVVLAFYFQTNVLTFEATFIQLCPRPAVLERSISGVFNLLKHAPQLIKKQRGVTHLLYNFSNMATVAHAQSMNKNNIDF